MGCFKALGTTTAATRQPRRPDRSCCRRPRHAMLVPPDPLRRFVDKRQIKADYAANGAQRRARLRVRGRGRERRTRTSRRSYYAWDPPEAPGFRFISIDTLSEGGIVEQSSNGNIDDPQFQWLERELQFAAADDKLIVVFGHHPIRSLNSNAPDEAAGACTGVTHTHGDVPEHDHNPGCDIDPRTSAPIHYGEPSQRPPGNTDETLSQLLTRFPHVIAYVAGHTHENRIAALHPRRAAECGGASRPRRPRTGRCSTARVEVMDNLDGTLVDLRHGARRGRPTARRRRPAAPQAFDEEMLASIGREFAYNDPQAGKGSGEGTADDQNVELLVKDPRTAEPRAREDRHSGSGPTGRDRSPTRSRSQTTGPRMPRR